MKEAIQFPEFSVRFSGAPIQDVLNDNVDVEIILKNGERYIPTFVTIRNIADIMDRHAQTGESANGRYFWTIDMIIVGELTIETIRAAVEDLLRDGLLHKACRRMEEVE